MRRQGHSDHNGCCKAIYKAMIPLQKSKAITSPIFCSILANKHLLWNFRYVLRWVSSVTGDRCPAQVNSEYWCWALTCCIQTRCEVRPSSGLAVLGSQAGTLLQPQTLESNIEKPRTSSRTESGPQSPGEVFTHVISSHNTVCVLRTNLRIGSRSRVEPDSRDA